MVLNRVLGSLRPGEIVLMHCGSNPDDHSTLDAAALPSVIQALQARGYAFVTLDVLRAPGTFGDEVNRFGNGFDVYGQRQAVNAAIAGWTATKADPVTTSSGSPARSRVPTGSTTRPTACQPGCRCPTPATTRQAPG